MYFYTVEKANCTVVVKNSIDDDLLTSREKKIIKKIIERTKKNGGVISEEDSDLFYEIEKRVYKEGGIDYGIEESVSTIEDYDFESYETIEIDPENF